MNEIRRMYATLLLSKIRQAAYRRVDTDESQPIPFCLYCDEFQEFQTSDFDKMLSMAGGLGLWLTLSHQYIDQLESRILHSIFGNVSTFILFRLGHGDAQAFKGEIPSMRTKKVWKRSPVSGEMEWFDEPVPFDSSLLTRLSKGEALYRAAGGWARFIQTPVRPKPSEARYAEIIRKRTIDSYSCDTPPVCFTESNDKPDEIKPTGPPDIPPHDGKKKNA